MSLNIHTIHLPPENLHPRRSYTSLHCQNTPLIHTETRDHPQSVSYDPALGSGSPAVSLRGRLCTSNRCYPTGRSLFGACTSCRWSVMPYISSSFIMHHYLARLFRQYFMISSYSILLEDPDFQHALPFLPITMSVAVHLGFQHTQ